MTLPDIEIQAARATETEASAPFSVTVLQRSDEAVAMEPALSLEDALGQLPGVWANDRGHFAEGDRLSIRGMGARASFGVRGVQVVLDGIPLTMPDGQAVVDVVDPAFIRRAEVMRGPSSLFWGNGSGGVLFLSTDDLSRSPAFRVRGMRGSYDLNQFLGEASVAAGAHRFQAMVSDIRKEGFRAYSSGRRTRAALHGALDLGIRTQVRFVAALADQDSESPGSLTRSQFQQNPRLANTGNVQKQAGKVSTQVQAGATLLQDLRVGMLSVTAYGIARDLNNVIPAGAEGVYIRLNRLAGGTRVAFQRQGRLLDWGMGLDAGRQGDDRQNWNNMQGQPGTERQIDQQETVRSAAAFAFATRHLSSRFSATLGVRADQIRFSLQDHLLENGDQSGSRTFAALSPAAGLAYRIDQVLLFANYGTAFETPTTTELVNRPDMSGGFNPDLEPQHTRGFEVGTRGVLPEVRLQFDIALFHMNIRDRLMPFQTEAGGDRDFYRNSGRNRHDGIEIATLWTPHRTIQLQAGYTGGRFFYQDGELDGNRLPGVPDHRFSAGIKVNHAGLWLHMLTEFVGSYHVNDANTEKNKSYTVSDLNVGYTGWKLSRAELEPFVNINNLMNSTYSGSVTVNAFGGRYYEPSPERTIQAGLNLSF